MKHNKAQDDSADRGGSMSNQPVSRIRDERNFIENLLCQRFNFFLIFYSLVVAGALSTESPRNFSIALSLGAIICFLISLPIARAQYKLDIYLELLKPEEHASDKTTQENKEKERVRRLVPRPMRWMARKSRRQMIGYWIPAISSAFLCLGAVLSWFGILRPV